MKRGKVSDTILDRSVFKLLGRRGNTSKPAYGQDAAHIHSQGWDTLAAAATGSLAVYRAVNNISAAGGAADCIMNTIIIDEKSREIRLKEIIKELDRQCQVVGVGIAGVILQYVRMLTVRLFLLLQLGISSEHIRKLLQGRILL